MLFKKIVAPFLLLLSTMGFSQEIELSPLSKISLITVGTGDELFAKFGHSGFRIQDPAIDIDYIYDYGGFDFDPPLFYVKFARGKLNYKMSGYHFGPWLKGYEKENRTVHEQTLNLSQNERNEIFDFLQNNYRKENRYYQYDFLFDNCATRIPEVLKSTLKDQLKLNYTHLDIHYTFRQLIHQCLNENAWATFGIDLALGSIIDRKATPWEHQFLPVYVNEQIANTTINGEDFVIKEKVLFDKKPIVKGGLFILTPLFWLLALFVVVVLITFFDYKKNTRNRWLDFSLFFITGAAGLLLFFLWFLTDHTFTKNNFNLLWALPMNIILAFILAKRKSAPQWVKKYLWVLLAFIFITVVIWVIKIQIFSPLIIFILAAMSIRYLYLLYFLKQSKSPIV